MAKYGLDLQQKSKSKKIRALVIAFICFALLLGSVSMLLLWRSLNYDFNNIFVKQDESTTSAPSTTSPEPVQYNGKYTFLVAVTSDDSKTTLFFNAIHVDLSEKVIRVVPINGEIKDSKTGLSCYDILLQNGIKSTVEFLNEYYDIKINKYVLLTETGYKSFFRTMGDLTLKVPEKVEYDTEDMFLELSRGENTLTPDKTQKYMKYLCETKTGYERAKSNANIIVAAFQNYCTMERFSSADGIFSVIINYCESDISIVDFTEAKDELEYLMPKSSKEQMKVFVSDNIKGETVGENENEEG